MATTPTYITPMQVQTAPAMILPRTGGFMNVGCIKGLGLYCLTYKPTKGQALFLT